MIKQKVIFIGSHDRSGSTILELILSRLDGFFSIGEFRHITRSTGFSSQQLCGCGEPIASCKFWQLVFGETALGETTQHRLVELRPRVDRFRHIRRYLNFTKADQDFKSNSNEYSRLIFEIFSKVSQISQSQFIIDSSKAPSYGFALENNPNLELYFIHLVRDSRAVAYSMSRKKRRPEVTWEEKYLPRYSFSQAALSWNIRNYALEILRAKAKNSMFLRYEDFVAHPEGSIQDILNFLGVDNQAYDVRQLLSNSRFKGHTINGNPVRFSQKPIVIRPDLAWSTEMQTLQKRAVTLLTLLPLKKYGYI